MTDSAKRSLQEKSDRGQLRIAVRADSRDRPIDNARVSIFYAGNPNMKLEELKTDISGLTDTITLPTPPVEYSMEPEQPQPYSEYNIMVEAEGYGNVKISGTALLSGITAIQEVRMLPVSSAGESASNIVIAAHKLHAEYPPKIAESEIKPMDEMGGNTRSQVIIPEFVVVHDGSPRDTTAKKYLVRYRDYIKNVVCSEIYPTWPKTAILANVLAIMSFTMNRVYTEWYLKRGYEFTISSSTAFDHKWSCGRNIYENISQIVDNIFTSYLTRPDTGQPILTQYCDGCYVSCPNWMSQWGSILLGEKGYSAIEIIRSYYGDSLFINSSEDVSGVPVSWPGTNLDIGSIGETVWQMQKQLNQISQSYPSLSLIGQDGIYDKKTKKIVREFQRIFNLLQTGVTDYATWFNIQSVYVAVTRDTKFDLPL